MTQSISLKTVQIKLV